MKDFDSYGAIYTSFQRSKSLSPLDWTVLYFLHKSGKTSSFTALFQSVAGNTPTTGKIKFYNRRFYNAIDRLITKNLVEQTYSKGGWKRWTITTAGIRALQRIDRSARQMLN